MCARWLTFGALLVASLLALAIAAPNSQDQQHHDADKIETDIGVGDLTDEEKRAWQNLHGVWGKRAWQDLNGPWGKRGWNDLNSAWGKRAWNDLNSAWGKRAWNDLNSAWGKRAWNDLNSAWGKRAWNDLNSAWGKRAWNDLNSAWGKRAWNDLNSAWGKRGPESRWQNLQGVWGKRSGTPSYDDELPEQLQSMTQPTYDEILLQNYLQGSDDELSSTPEKKAWNNLHGVWGKRPLRALNGPYWKREPGWTKLRGMWGKRSSSDIEEKAGEVSTN